MRPIVLQFSGLHSDMEEQTIDFSALGAYGLFGIFGPTGAGKSTILDAITLALHGSMRIKELGDKAHVALEFSLGETVYVVERLLERDKKDKEKTNTKQCRLYDKTHDTVLADKAIQVDGLILDLLGIGMEDFCRAVVLPQGKFQEFLTLTGKDRGEMLENIFGLEKYGDGLTAKILRCKTQLDMTLASLRGELMAVSSYTEEDKTVMEAQLLTVRGQTKILEGEKQKAEEVYHRCEQLEKHAKELQETEALLSQLAAEQPQIDRWQEILAKLQIFRSLLHSVNQAEALTAQLEEERPVIAQQKATWEQCAKELERLEQQSASLPTWQEEVERLEKTGADLARLQPVMEELAEIVKQEMMLAADSREKQTQMSQLTQAAEVEKKQIEGLKEQIAQKEKEKAALQELISQREWIARGIELQKNDELHRKNMERVRDDCLRHGKKINDCYAEICHQTQLFYGTVDRAIPIAEESEKSGMLTEEQLAAYEAKISRLCSLVEDRLQQATQDRETAEQKGKELEQQYLRQQLAQTLIPGEPCPVCGSIDHPMPTVTDGCGKEEWERQKEHLDALRKDYEEHLQSQAKLVQQGQQFASLAEEYRTVYLPAFCSCEKEYLVATNQWQQWETDFSKRHRTFFADVCRQLEEADKQWLAVTREQEKLNQDMKSYEERLDEKREQYRNLQSSLEKIAAQRELGEKQKDRYEKEVTSCCEQWNLPVVTELSQLTAFLTQIGRQLEEKKQQIAMLLQGKETAAAAYQEANNAYQTGLAVQTDREKNRNHLRELVMQAAKEKGVITESETPWQEIIQGMAMLEQQETIERNIAQYQEKKTAALQKQTVLQEALSKGHYEAGACAKAAAQYEEKKTAYDRSLTAEAALAQRYEDCLAMLEKRKELTAECREKEIQLERLTRLQKLCAGKKLIKYLSQEYLTDMAYEASQLLEVLTNHRYSLEVVGKDGFKENFIMADAYNGGQLRPVKSLSGGETFLVSLALALALSNKIQLKGKYSLDFFFLDEGFGTLDEEKLEVVLSVLEKLPIGNKMVGIITHVPELKTRLPRFLTVSPAAQGKSSQIQLGMN